MPSSDLKHPPAKASSRALIEQWSPESDKRFFSADPDPVFTLHRQFESQVERTPDAIAFTFEGVHWTFRELDEHGNHVAGHLQELGLGPDKLAGLYLERGPALMVAIVAIHKASGASGSGASERTVARYCERRGRDSLAHPRGAQGSARCSRCEYCLVR